MRLFVVLFTFHAHAPIFNLYIEYDFNYMKGSSTDVVPPLVPGYQFQDRHNYINLQAFTINYTNSFLVLVFSLTWFLSHAND